MPATATSRGGPGRRDQGPARRGARTPRAARRRPENSSTSSKPPSSDIAKPKPAPDPVASGPRTIGGQPGHPKHEREPFPPEQLTSSAEYHLDACPCCGGRLRRNGPFAKVVQQI